MNSFLLFLGGTLILALSALFAVPYFVDWNDYRDVFEAQATKLVGRPVDVGGDVSLTLLPAPVVRFETINVADASGAFNTPFASARSFTVWLSVPPLLRGTIEARSVEIDEPVLNLRIGEDGSGNWSEIGGEAAKLPFIPKEVSLNSVEINGASINVWRGEAEPDYVIEQINGELTADSLQGPYRFRGELGPAEKRREIRFSTGPPEADGGFRLKASMRSPDAREVYAIDGGVRGFGRIPVFKGDFNARLSDESLDGKSDGENGNAQGTAPFEIKAQLFGGLTGAQFNEVEFTVTRNNKPQTVTGLLDMQFSKGLTVAGTFSSRYVELDSWFGTDKDAPPDPRMAVAALAGGALDRASVVREGSIRLFVDQAVIAGDLVSGIQAELSMSDDKDGLQIDRLSALMPGENKLRLQGSLAREGEGTVFSGPVSVDGDSLSRLLRWAGFADAPGAVAQTGAFAVEGDLSAGPNEISLQNVQGSLFGSAFDGAFSYRGGADSAVSLTLKSDRMDLATALGANASAKSLWTLFNSAGSPGQEGGDRPGGPLAWLGGMRAEADVSIGAASFAGLGESALHARVALADGILEIHRLKLTSGSDVSLQAGGRLTRLDGKTQGQLTFAAQADNGSGLASLGEFLDLDSITGSSPEQLDALTPVYLTAAARSTEQETQGLDVQLEGSLGESDLLVKMDMQGGPAEWKTAPMTLQGSLKNPSAALLVQQLRPRLTRSGLAAIGDGEGLLSVEADGAAETGLKTKISLDAGGVNWNAQGTYRFGESGSSFSGATDMAVETMTAGLALFGIPVAPAQGSDPARLSANVELENGIYRLQKLDGAFGDATFTGEARADMSGQRPSITARVSAPEASLPKLLSPIVSWESEGGNSQVIRGVSSTGSYWPEAPFNSALLGRADGSLSLRTDRLQMTGGLLLDNAKVDAELSDGTLKVSSLEGRLYGGNVKASGALSARGGAMAFDAQAVAEGLKLDQIVVTSNGEKLVDAPADLTLLLNGEGLTPQGLVSSLNGSGQLDIGAGKLTGFSLGAAHAAASAAQREKESREVGEDELGRRVASHLEDSNMAFTPIRAPYTINNGIVEFNRLALSDAEGRVTIATLVELSTMKLDSEWALQSAESARGGAKPRVSLVFSGALEKLGRIQPRIDTGGLARYVTIRKMEKDVERLENLDVTGRGQQQQGQQQQHGQQQQQQQQQQAGTPSPVPLPPLPRRKRTVLEREAEPAAQSSADAAPQDNAEPPQAEDAPPSVVPVPEPNRKPRQAAAAPDAPALPEIPSVQPPPSAPAEPSSETPPQDPQQPNAAESPSGAPQPPQDQTEPPQAPEVATVPPPADSPPPAPLPARKPSLPRPAPGAASEPPPASEPAPAAEPAPQPAPEPPQAPPPAQTAAPQPAPDQAQPPAPQQQQEAPLPWLQSGQQPPEPSGTGPGPIQLPAPSAQSGPDAPQRNTAPPPPPPATRQQEEPFNPFGGSG